MSLERSITTEPFKDLACLETDLWVSFDRALFELSPKVARRDGRRYRPVFSNLFARAWVVNNREDDTRQPLARWFVEFEPGDSRQELGLEIARPKAPWIGLQE